MTKTKAEREDLEAFETAYNAACESIAGGELGQAEVLLKRAESMLCEDSGSQYLRRQVFAMRPISHLSRRKKTYCQLLFSDCMF